MHPHMQLYFSQSSAPRKQQGMEALVGLAAGEWHEKQIQQFLPNSASNTGQGVYTPQTGWGCPGALSSLLHLTFGRKGSLTGSCSKVGSTEPTASCPWGDVPGTGASPGSVLVRRSSSPGMRQHPQLLLSPAHITPGARGHGAVALPQ